MGYPPVSYLFSYKLERQNIFLRIYINSKILLKETFKVSLFVLKKLFKLPNISACIDLFTKGGNGD